MEMKRGEKIILNELEGNPGTFTELQKRTKLSTSTLSKYLEDLQSRGFIEREYIPSERKPLERRRPKWLIKLSAKALSPIEKILRHLETVLPEPSKELGRKLLTEPVIQTLMDIQEAQSKLGSKFWKYEFEPSKKFDEAMVLLSSLAIYYLERFRLPRMLKRGEISSFDSKKFVAVPLVKKRELLKTFDKLTEWADSISKNSPLIDGFGAREASLHFLLLMGAHYKVSKKTEGGEKP